ncbi:MAG: hypothetical protein KJ659_00930 [Actinobacteria bacterium]|nr:hypothetical protein [Actinomycetota bacterium]MBU1608923.1 hypothetical protein [Actinomycetota bacterium]MBU2316364.1 hypothetical protein [Actinomycetota bacterium]MBU2384054.1 hypothetical protein [Actinomycetota bacterium]
MAKGISISMAADTRAFITGVQKGVIDPLDDAGEILEDLGRDGSRNVDKLEDSLRDAQRETDDTRKKFSDLQKEIRETGRKSRTDFAKPVGDSADRVKRDLDEVRTEAKQNAAEMFSSFDGSFESIADAAQGTLGGLTSGLGGVGGMAAVAAGAAGIGLVTAALNAAKEETERLAEITDKAFSQMQEARQGYLMEDAILDNITEIYESTDQLTKAQNDATKAGLEESLVVRALAGDSEALATAQQLVADKLTEVQTKANDYYKRTGELNFALIAQEEDLTSVRDELGKTGGAYDAAADRYSSYQQAIKDAESSQRDEIARTRDADQSRWEALGRKYEEAAARGPIKLSAELQQPDVDSVRRGIENNFSRRPARVQARVFTRSGTEVF